MAKLRAKAAQEKEKRDKIEVIDLDNDDVPVQNLLSDSEESTARPASFSVAVFEFKTFVLRIPESRFRTESANIVFKTSRDHL